jgi:hypothetical protein
MSWPIKFIKGARPGLKRLAQVTSDSAINAETNIMKRRKGLNGLRYKSSSVPSFREKYSSRENKHFKFLPVNFKKSTFKTGKRF